MKKSLFMLLFVLLLIGCSKPKQAGESQPVVTQPTGPVCGDNVCQGETQDSCPQDCGHLDICVDTENVKDKNIKGTVSGFFNNNSYSFVDKCLNDKILQEFFCANDTISSENISCEGKPITNEYCNATALYKDTITPGCEDGVCKDVKQRRILKICELGCENARCVTADQGPEETVAATDNDTCNDSDGGFNLGVKGIVSGMFNNTLYHYSDYCDQYSIVEYTCKGHAYSSQETPCPTDTSIVMYCFGSNVYSRFVHYACVHGACLNTTAPKLAKVCDQGCANGVCI